ncbi:hypothetical protein [Roseimaritima sediminicola]|uniref:hypothetical protein n=1 Tax=Roseimaritima sediminicola TaxID=2662066 RepID=UPI0012982CD6|nr:hypothetical protein [Roseimaritima sediminicola]
MTVSTAIATITVNPAFLQEIKDSNPDLWKTLEEVHDCFHSVEPRATVAARLVRLLDDLRDHLALQFALEEAYGYIEVPAGVAMPEAENARRQHCSLYLEISELSERAEELQYRGLAAEQLALLVDEARLFDARLDAHERLERRLIERANDGR